MWGRGGGGGGRGRRIVDGGGEARNIFSSKYHILSLYLLFVKFINYKCLINIIGNSLKFTKVGEIFIEVMLNKKDGTVQFIIKDTGIGISL